MARKLRAQAGTDEANYGELRMPVDRDGTVDVPDEAVESLLATGGFVTMDDPVEIPDGFVLATSVGVDSTSWGGTTYEPDASGVFTVPAAAMAELMSHGFIPAPGAPAKQPEPPEPPATPPATVIPKLTKA